MQDSLIGGYNLTADDMVIDWKNAMNILSYVNSEKADKIQKGRDYTGYELFSMIIPEKISVRKFDKDQPLLVIENGIMTAGHLDAAALGPSKKNNLVQLVLDQYDYETAKEFLDNVNRLINNFNLYYGFTVGIGDVDITPELEKQILVEFATKKLQVEHLITDMENNPDLLDQALFERTVFDILNVIRDDVSKLLVDNLKAKNNFKVMMKSGSKGDPVNVGQMRGCTGQQAMENKRIAKKYNNRTLPYFFQNDDRAHSRGFIERSYMTGLTWPDFVFHTMTAREGLIDQAIKTAESFGTQALVE